MDYFPDDAQQHLKEMRSAIVRLTQSINMGNEYIRAQFARFGTQHIACCILNEACCTKIQNSYSAEYKQRVYAGFFIVVCSLCNSLLVYFPDAAQQHLKETRSAIVRLTQSISMGNEYIRK